MPRSARRVSACCTSCSFPMARASSNACTNRSRAWAFLASALSGVAYFNRSSAFTISSKISFASNPAPSDPADLHDRLHVPVTPLERLHPCGERHPPGHQPVQPPAVGPRKRIRGLLIVPPVGVHRTEHHVVFQHHLRVQRIHV